MHLSWLWRHLSEREIAKIEKDDPECTIKVECQLCHNRYQILIGYTDKQGKLDLYDEIKSKITNPPPDELMQHIYGIKWEPSFDIHYSQNLHIEIP